MNDPRAHAWESFRGGRQPFRPSVAFAPLTAAPMAARAISNVSDALLAVFFPNIRKRVLMTAVASVSA